jgi:hypothetical protein
MAFLYFIARDVQLVAAFLADKLVWSHGDGWWIAENYFSEMSAV